jgi:hypothetical protein
MSTEQEIRKQAMFVEEAATYTVTGVDPITIRQSLNTELVTAAL